MTAIGQKFTHYTGTSRRLLIPLVYPDKRPFDHAVGSAEWLCSESSATPIGEVFIRKSIGDGVTIVEMNGVPTMVVQLRPGDTRLGANNGIKPGNLHHEARISWAVEDEALVLTGSMELKRRL